MDIHTIIRDLKSRKDPEVNLQLYADCVKKEAAGFSYINLALHLLALAERADEIRADSEILKKTAEISENTVQGRPADPAELLEMRSANIGLMQKFSDDVDAFSLSEYAMNRIEHRFVGSKAPEPSYSDQKMTDELIRFLAAKQGEEQNLYVVRLAEQLPVRMTKSRFYELVTERLTIYRESDRNAFDEVLERLYTAAGLKEIADDRLKSVAEVLSSDMVKELDSSRFEALQASMTDISEDLNAKMDIFQSVQEVINDLMVLSLCGAQETDEKVTQAVRMVVSYACVLLGAAEAGDSEAEAYDACSLLEGLPEQYIMDYTEAAAHEEDLKARFPELTSSGSIGEEFEILRKTGILLSGSSFAPLEDTETLPMDDAYFREKVLGLLAALKAKLDVSSRIYVRSMMARCFSVLPPHFSTQEELETFIYESLRSCTDDAEKAGTVELMDQIMAD